MGSATNEALEKPSGEVIGTSMVFYSRNFTAAGGEGVLRRQPSAGSKVVYPMGKLQ